MQLNIDKINPPTMANSMAVWLALETSSFSFAPKYWEIIIVAPDDSPIKKTYR